MVKRGRRSSNTWYAVLNGREGGRKVYRDWETAKINVERVKGCRHRCFSTESEAIDWLSQPRPREGGLFRYFRDEGKEGEEESKGSGCEKNEEECVVGGGGGGDDGDDPSQWRRRRRGGWGLDQQQVKFATAARENGDAEVQSGSFSSEKVPRLWKQVARRGWRARMEAKPFPSVTLGRGKVEEKEVEERKEEWQVLMEQHYDSVVGRVKIGNQREDAIGRERGSDAIKRVTNEDQVEALPVCKREPVDGGKAVEEVDEEDEELWAQFEDRPGESGASQPRMEVAGDEGLKDEFFVPARAEPGSEELSEEQKRVSEMVLEEGTSILLTGGAGTGKTFLLRHLIKKLREKYRDNPHAVAVTATTGIAGVNVGGSTIHRWSGIGLGNLPARKLAENISGSKSLLNSWKMVEVLVIDEVSMLDAILFDKLEFIAKAVRERRGEPFGGIQIVACGDFYQLPPVIKNETFHHFRDRGDFHSLQKTRYQRLCASYKSRYVFDSHTWSRVIQRTVSLEQVFRQKDQGFMKALEMIRRGVHTPFTDRFFNHLGRPVAVRDGIELAELFSTRNEVSRANEAKLARLAGEGRTFQARDEAVALRHYTELGGKAKEDLKAKLLKDLDRSVVVPKRITLKRNAQVMLVKNLTNGLVNGSYGVVVGFQRISRSDQVFQDGDGRIWASGDGTSLAFEVAQGSGGGMEKGGQVERDRQGKGIGGSSSRSSALSQILEDVEPNQERGRLESGGFLAADIARHGSIVGGDGVEWPVVRFVNDSTTETQTMLVPPMEFSIESAATAQAEATRKQVPLILAWAISIHKSQGQTLQRVKVNMSRIFEAGQAYVALSRATGTEGLQVIHYDPSKVVADWKVLEWERKTFPNLKLEEDVKEEIERLEGKGRAREGEGRLSS